MRGPQHKIHSHKNNLKLRQHKDNHNLRNVPTLYPHFCKTIRNHKNQTFTIFLIINALRNLASYTISDFKQKVVRPSPQYRLIYNNLQELRRDLRRKIVKSLHKFYLRVLYLIILKCKSSSATLLFSNLIRLSSSFGFERRFILPYHIRDLSITAKRS